MSVGGGTNTATGCPLLRGVSVSYIQVVQPEDLEGSSVFDFSLLPRGNHRVTEIRVLVTPVEPMRWAEVDCACGETLRVDWSPSHRTYAELVELAWRCGFIDGLVFGSRQLWR